MAPSIVHHVTPRFIDLDTLGHVNNAVYLTYLEEARVAFFRRAYAEEPLPDWEFVLARAEIDYKRPVLHGDDLEIRVTLDRWGRSSFDFAYEGCVAGELAFEARTVQVFFDRRTGRPKPVPDDFRNRVEKVQQSG